MINSEAIQYITFTGKLLGLFNYKIRLDDCLTISIW